LGCMHLLKAYQVQILVNRVSVLQEIK